LCAIFSSRKFTHKCVAPTMRILTAFACFALLHLLQPLDLFTHSLSSVDECGACCSKSMKLMNSQIVARLRTNHDISKIDCTYYTFSTIIATTQYRLPFFSMLLGVAFGYDLWGLCWTCGPQWGQKWAQFHLHLACFYRNDAKASRYRTRSITCNKV